MEHDSTNMTYHLRPLSPTQLIIVGYVELTKNILSNIFEYDIWKFGVKRKKEYRVIYKINKRNVKTCAVIATRYRVVLRFADTPR